jgi:Protein of unknown function (DUF4239)
VVPLINAIPGWAALLLITLTCVLVACGGHVWVHRSLAKTNFFEHNEVAGFLLAVVGVLYAVLLGFITVVVWEHFSQSQERAQAEVDAATDIWRFGELLPAREAARIRHDVGRYAIVVADDEWPKMREGKSSASAQKLILALFTDVAQIQVLDRQRSNLQNQLFERVQVVADLRRHRINDIGSTVVPVIKLALLLGALLVLSFLYLFGLKDFRIQLIMTGATAGMIGILFSLIILLDYPFRGDVTVAPDRWYDLHEAIAQER